MTELLQKQLMDYKQLKEKIPSIATDFLDKFTQEDITKLGSEIKDMFIKNDKLDTTEAREISQIMKINFRNCIIRADATIAKEIHQVHQVKNMEEESDTFIAQAIKIDLSAIKDILKRNFQTEGTTFYIDFTERSKRDIVTYFQKVNHKEVTFQVKKEIEKKLKKYLKNFSRDTLIGINQQFIRKVELQNINYFEQTKLQKEKTKRKK